jgi:hypothetical protein
VPTKIRSVPTKIRSVPPKIFTFFFLLFLRFFTRKTSLAIASSVLWCLSAMNLGFDMLSPVFSRNHLHVAFWRQAVLIVSYATLVSTLARARHVALCLYGVVALLVHVLGTFLSIFLPFILEIICPNRCARFIFLFGMV